jgi:transposase
LSRLPGKRARPVLRGRGRSNAPSLPGEADDLPHLHSLATGLRRDLAAVTAGLTEQHNSGPVEGHVNRVKTIKRQMYGRASFELLRKRILLAA